MRIEVPCEAERLGANLLHGVQKVYELDSGLAGTAPEREEEAVLRVSYEAINEVTKEMAIVVPVMGERIKLIDGVLAGIPHDCLTILVSNSPRTPIDRFVLERNAMERLRRFTRKPIMVVHQKDPALASALADAGYPELLDEDGLVRNGKAEGMLIATLLAKLAGKRFLGFIDADNYFPGAVHEYVSEYGAGFATAGSSYAMVRISWHSKPKIVDSSLFFSKYGRVSVVTNRFLNALIGHYTGFETEVIRTANAGEHALTMDLAMRLTYAAGYAIETQHFVDLFEKFGSIIENPSQDVLRQYVEVYQIESRNPHLHDVGKGGEHIGAMLAASLGVIYHSPICPPALRDEILFELRQRGVVGEGDEPRQPLRYPPLAAADLGVLADRLAAERYASHFRP